MPLRHESECPRWLCCFALVLLCGIGRTGANPAYNAQPSPQASAQPQERSKRMAFSKTTSTAPRSTGRVYSLIKLPVELILLIGKQVRRMQDFQNLRLVCKLFDEIFTPVVLSHIHLRSYPPATLPGGASLRDLTRRCEQLTFVKSLTIYSLEWLVFQPEGIQELRPAAKCYLTHPFRRLFSLRDVPPLSSELAAIQGIYYLKRLQPSTLPNLESVKWFIQMEGTKKSRCLLMKALISLPNLKELDLSLNLYKTSDMLEFTELLTQVKGLQKLTLRMHRGHSNCYEHYLEHFGLLIANNPNLSHLHLSWHDDATLFPLRVLSYVPADSPSRLKHLLLDTHNISIESDVVSHLRYLQSLDMRWVAAPDFWETLANEGVFIPSIKIAFVTEALCEYLLLNRNLTSLTIARPTYLAQARPQILLSPNLFRALEGTTVEHVTLSPSNWGRWHRDAEIEACLRRCTGLRKITLVFENDCIVNFKEVRSKTRTVSRLGEKITLEILADDYVFRAFRSICSSYSDPLLRSLQQRLEFSELDS